MKHPLNLEMKNILGCVCALFTNAVTNGQWLCGKCAEGNGDGCIGICPGKSIEIAIIIAGLRVDM
jgi:hypothetical protein